MGSITWMSAPERGASQRNRKRAVGGHWLESEDEDEEEVLYLKTILSKGHSGYEDCQINMPLTSSPPEEGRKEEEDGKVSQGRLARTRRRIMRGAERQRDEGS
jgi:hypothetical protein